MTGKKYWFVGGVIGFCLNINPVCGQITVDGTTDTSVVNNCQSSCNITGGTVAGDNLFHSFDRFNLGTGESAYFVDPGVANIFSRVTGNEASHIFGTLGVSGGDANLFLLNPNGIIFGAGAALDVNGSFLATTANEIQFGDRSFSATPNSQENLALLNINPSALFFNQMAQNQPIGINSGTILQVPEQKTLTLLGGQPADNIPGINLKFGGLFAFDGNVVVGAVRDGGKIGIDENLYLSFPKDVNKGDISLSQGSGINVSGIGGGNVSLQGSDVFLTGKSNIYSSTTGNLDGGTIDLAVNNLTLAENSTISTISNTSGKSSDIKITAQESINSIGSDINKFQQFLIRSISEALPTGTGDTSINTIALGEGDSGNIEISSQNLHLSNGARILTTTANVGNAGNINVDVGDAVTLDSSGLITGTSFGSSGNAGNINVDSNSFILENSSLISSATIGKGNGGDITLNIANSVELRQSLVDGFIPTGIVALTVLDRGVAGNITINTDRLTLEDGAAISSSSGTISSQGTLNYGGLGGNITIDATDSILITGTSPNQVFPSGIVSNTFTNESAGNIKVHTGKLAIADRGEIAVSSLGGGTAGNLNIISNSIEIDNGGSLNATTRSGNGGNIILEAKDILSLNNGSKIVADAFDNSNKENISIGDGGNIRIDTNFVVAFGASNISARAKSGRGGNINIDARDLFVGFDSQITASASSELGGVDGEVNIKTFNTSDRHNLFRLPEPKLQADRTIAKNCGQSDRHKDAFTYTGRGGLPINPLTEVRSSYSIIADFGIIHPSNTNNTFEVNKFRPRNTTNQIIEAQNWKTNQNGKVELYANNSSVTSNFYTSTCPLF